MTLDISQQGLDASQIVIAPSFDEVEGFASLPLRDLTPGAEVPFDVFIKIKRKGVREAHFLKCCDRGAVFQEDWHEKLRQMQVPCVYLSLEEVDQILQYLQHQLEILLTNADYDGLQKGLRVCDATHMWTLNFFTSTEPRTGEQIEIGLNLLDTLFAVVRGDRYKLLYLTEIRHHSFQLYTHCLNVCLLGLDFTSYLGWEPENVRDFGIGALIHDIGSTNVPRRILEKRGELTAEETALVQRHPLDGFQMLQDFAHLRRDCLEMVRQHHENGDGSGYPNGLKIDDIHHWARILRILDSYVAMTAERPWRSPMEPKEALWVMRTDWEEKNLFDKNYLKTFIKFLASK
jgi:HD-GYP domain-containing protein (c-di-GMP phosphodiesterase class II)